MFQLSKTRMALAAAAWALLATQAGATERLDGKVFTGMIGPAEAPDLSDRLLFDNGHFWSDICTRCGFLPGEYTARETEEGTAFTGTLESESRGRFEYEGLVRPDGSIEVSIDWERRRWYWTSRRSLVFIGALAGPADMDLPAVYRQIEQSDPDQNPACSRF